MSGRSSSGGRVITVPWTCSSPASPLRRGESLWQCKTKWAATGWRIITPKRAQYKEGRTISFLIFWESWSGLKQSSGMVSCLSIEHWALSKISAHSCAKEWGILVLGPSGRDEFGYQSMAWRCVTGLEQVEPQVFVNGGFQLPMVMKLPIEFSWFVTKILGTDPFADLKSLIIEMKGILKLWITGVVCWCYLPCNPIPMGLWNIWVTH